ncbi:hypothetical protein GCK32_000609 [Trichostrongylus colubriformis]|uniref:Uncharacterized protein n=1 Tax=Trichostrongylus colubriformis TaxID=6319 RepID=A0AAN8J310_TRICO
MVTEKYSSNLLGFFAGQLGVIRLTVVCLGLILLHFFFFYKDYLEEDVCICTDSYGNEFDFCYRSKENASMIGRKFACEHLEQLYRLELLGAAPSVRITDDLRPVFVTAFSQSHFMEGKRLIASIRKFHKKAIVIVYDLGLTLKGAVRVKRWCRVVYRRFRFEDYPPFFELLHTFRWKPIIIAETLRDYGAVWYMDTSVILEKGDLRHVQTLVTCKARPPISLPFLTADQRDIRESHWNNTSGWDTVQWTANVKECKKSTYLLHSFTGHGIYAATDPALYSYFPVSVEELRKPKAKMYEAGLVFAVKTRETTENVLKWSVLCALEEDCMGTKIIPNACQFNTSDYYTSFARCHRYDQSVVNVLLADSYYYDRHYYSSEITDFFRIQRFLAHTVGNRELKCD